MNPAPQFRTFTALVTDVITGDQGRAFIKITSIDDRLSSAIVVFGDEVEMKNSVSYTVVKDEMKKHPVFDFYSKKEGAKKIEDICENEHIVVLLEIISASAFRFVHWTTLEEYRACEMKIKARIRGFHGIQGEVKKEVTDKATYRLTYDNMKFCGTPDEISRRLYTDRISQENGWPQGSWEQHTGRRFEKCDAPNHPGSNSFLEGHCILKR